MGEKFETLLQSKHFQVRNVGDCYVLIWQYHEGNGLPLFAGTVHYDDTAETYMVHDHLGTARGKMTSLSLSLDLCKAAYTQMRLEEGLLV